MQNYPYFVSNLGGGKNLPQTDYSIRKRTTTGKCYKKYSVFTKAKLE